MTQAELFIGPLPEEVYRVICEETGLFRQDRVVELAARALYGQELAQRRADELEDRVIENAIDGLTGVYNRDATYQQLQHMICGLEIKRRSTDAYDGLLVLFFDVDDFKKINDRSWAQGNKALQTVGSGLMTIARSSRGDFPGRIGGDEFLLVVPFSADKVNELKLLETLEDRIRHFLPYRYPSIPSLKWHHAFYAPGDSAETFINKAEPKGVNKAVARAHNQSEQEYKRAFKRATAAVA